VDPAGICEEPGTVTVSVPVTAPSAPRYVIFRHLPGGRLPDTSLVELPLVSVFVLIVMPNPLISVSLLTGVVHEVRINPVVNDASTMPAAQAALFQLFMRVLRAGSGCTAESP
jgi:hypothetical protein